jgi:uncharacterized membrane protein YqjE
MADPDRPLFADAQDQIARLAADLWQMVDLRWQLARLELEAAFRSVRRLAILWATAAVMASTALPLLVLGVVQLLPEEARVYGLWIFALGLLMAAAVVGWLAWRRFRRRFTGLEETLEELREDLVWLQEWAGRNEGEQVRGE